MMRMMIMPTTIINDDDNDEYNDDDDDEDDDDGDYDDDNDVNDDDDDKKQRSFLAIYVKEHFLSQGWSCLLLSSSLHILLIFTLNIFRKLWTPYVIPSCLLLTFFEIVNLIFYHRNLLQDKILMCG